MKKNKSVIKKSIYIALIIINIILILYVIKYCYDIYISKKESSLLDNISISANEEKFQSESENAPKDGSESIAKSQGNSESDSKSNSKSAPVNTNRISKVKELQKINSDIVGWIEIENTNINYPVLQGSDNNFYIRHNYKKDYSFNGSIFLDKDYSWNPPSSNLLIYGHNNKNNTMFQDLLKYKDIDFYKQHPVVRFTTNSEDANFDIISAFPSKVYYKSDTNVFRYYYFIDSKNESEYNSYVTNAKNASLYDTGKTAKYGDQLMTLSTCSYHTTDGRFVVVARKISKN